MLFDRTSLTEILKTPTEEEAFFNFQNIDRIQGLLSDFMQKKTFADKEEFVKQLNADHYELLVRTYFNIVENTIFENQPLRH